MKKSYTENRIARWMSALVVIALLAGTRIVLAGNDAADEAAATIRPEAIRADMRFLADDLLEGRGTGTRGHEIAAKFMASEFEAMGLSPADFVGIPNNPFAVRAQITVYLPGCLWPSLGGGPGLQCVTHVRVRDRLYPALMIWSSEGEYKISLPHVGK